MGVLIVGAIGPGGVVSPKDADLAALLTVLEVAAEGAAVRRRSGRRGASVISVPGTSI
jgi:hypothetical protein